MDKLYIVVPAYNEQDNIKDFVQDWYPIIEKYGSFDSKLVVVDDGSKDNTYEVLKELNHHYPKLLPITKENGGHGQTVLFAYRYAIDNEADYIFQTDSDRQTNPDEFEGFWQIRNDYDAIIGKRISRGDGKIREYVEKIVCLILRVIFGVKLKDANAPFRLMKRELVNKYINKLPDDFNLPNIMFTTYFSYYKEKIMFVPISFKPRTKGTNSINIKRIIKIGIKAIGDFYNLKKDI